jgi:hypothetical protein
MLRHEANFGKNDSIKFPTEWVSFFTKHEKKGRCFF